MLRAMIESVSGMLGSEESADYPGLLLQCQLTEYTKKGKRNKPIMHRAGAGKRTCLLVLLR